MDVMELRRMVLSSIMKKGDNVKIKQGTFVGDGTNFQTISCDFEPDVILAECPSADGGALGEIGLEFLVVVKDKLSASYEYDTATSTTPVAATSVIYTNQNWSQIWSYSNGIMTFGRNHRYPRYCFINGATYNYTFIKYTEDN